MTTDRPFAGLQSGHFACIYADPPWRFQTYDKKEGKWSAGQHYRTMTIQDIINLDVDRIAADDCHLFMWVTTPMLEVSFLVMEAWGFKYSSIGFVWVKLIRRNGGKQFRMVADLSDELHTGLGHTTRKNVEICLLGRRGSPKRLAKNVHEVIVAPVREHSRKPDEAIRRIEAYCPGPRIELFARSRRDGWSTWGDEADKFTDR